MLENANPDTFRAFYRFHQDEMPRLLRSLAIPAEFRLDNGSWVNGQEALMVTLRLLAYPLRYSDVEEAFGWKASRLCRIKVMMIKWVYSNHKHRVRDYLHWHIRYIQQSKDAMQRKKLVVSGNNHLPQRSRNVAWVIDGFRVRVSLPLRGENEVNTQALVYNKWIKVHNILFQNVTSPYGLIVDFSGPYLGKDDDLVALRDSDVLNRLRLALIAAGLDPVDYDMLGDKLYVNAQNICRALE